MTRRPAFVRPSASLATVGALACLAASAPAQAASSSGSIISCDPVTIAAVHGGPVSPNKLLTTIRNGRVLALDAVSGRRAHLRFRGRWVTTGDGRRMAVVGQELRREGRIYVVAGPLPVGGRVPCAGQRSRSRAGQSVRARAADTASYPSDGSLGTGLIRMETAASTRNASGQTLGSYEDRVACTGTSTHPDRAILYSHPTPTVWCFKGRSSWMSSPRGIDSDCPPGGCDPNYDRCSYGPLGEHAIVVNAATVSASKRPLTKPNGEIIPTGAIAWRPAISSMRYPAGFNPEANRVAPPPRRVFKDWLGDRMEPCVWT